MFLMERLITFLFHGFCLLCLLTVIHCFYVIVKIRPPLQELHTYLDYMQWMLVYLCWIISTENLLVFLNRCIVSHFHSFDIVLWSNKFSICVGLIITVNYILFWIIVHCMRSIRIRISNHLQFIPLHLQQFCHWRVEHLNFNNHFFNWTPKSVVGFICSRLEVNALLCLRTNFNYLVLINMDKCLTPKHFQLVIGDFLFRRNFLQDILIQSC